MVASGWTWLLFTALLSLIMIGSLELYNYIYREEIAKAERERQERAAEYDEWWESRPRTSGYGW